MTKEKQIEEMAWELENHTCMSQFQAEIASKMLYTLGYRKQSANVIELPCKIGETMYVVSRYYTGNWEIFECKVDSITMYGTHTFISLISKKGNFIFGENVSSINKNVFFIEEEAKKAWAKMKGSIK